MIMAFAMLLFSCQRMEEVLESHVVEFEVIDEHADQTRAYHDFEENKAIWENGDLIGCFAGMNVNLAFTNSKEDPKTFTGSVLGEPDLYNFYFPITNRYRFTLPYPYRNSSLQDTIRR